MKKNNAMTNMNFRVHKKLREDFGKKCGENRDGTPSGVLRRLMSDYIEGKITYHPQQET